ncbi:MAG: two-component system, OmpR family, response regulator [Verrucomicrobia bacterium]|nr:MAG: two-component system, OmpR family, response regulator [Verrucomicrobiota bacterium]
MNDAMKILIVEDDPAIRMGLEEVLRGEGYEVLGLERGDEVVERALAGFPADLILLDVMLPGRNGYDCCRALRESGVGVPVLMLTAKGREADKLTGFDCGADDYVTKPFGIKELAARVRALLRRARENGAKEREREAGGVFRIGENVIDPVDHSIRIGEVVTPLTPRECGLLVHLQMHRGRLLTRDELLTAVWSVNAAAVTTRTLDQTVAQVRRKLGDAASQPRWILTVHGVGYKLALE